MTIHLIQELRELTGAGMNDCKQAIAQAEGDLQKAIDWLKVKGLAIANNLTGRTASEGRIAILASKQLAIMMEVNSETDFVANSPDFQTFTVTAAGAFLDAILNGTTFQAENVEKQRQALVAKTKENIVVRRWWAEQAFAPEARVFTYTHSNAKIGVLLTLLAPTVETSDLPEFSELGDNLAMQVAAMGPLAVSSDRLLKEDLDRQHKIFQTQLEELKKPTTAWPKILEGKMAKWYQTACLLDQEAVWLSKNTVKQAIQGVAQKLGGDIQVVNFIRCQVGT
jgi:elongation factor Ts